MSEFCPQCGTARVGAFRFCRHCRFDFDGATPEPTAAVERMVKRSMASRLTGRQWLGAGVALIVGLGVLGNLTTPAASTAGPQASPGATARTVALASPSPTPWRTAKAPLAALTPTGPTESAEVVRIVDGDTIVVSLGGKNVRLRYIGMDTPEDVDPNSPVEPMSREAAAANTALVSGKTVVLEKDVSETDQYGRLLRYVWLHEGSTWTMVNLELVRMGLASAATYPPDVKYVDLFTSTESAARSSFVGLWGTAPSLGPTPAATSKAAPRLTPKPTPKATVKPSSCHPSYTPCLPIVDDLDCPDVRAMGKAPVTVIGPDDYRLDNDHDGLGCE